jgi:Dyp-type peroxidase family
MLNNYLPRNDSAEILSSQCDETPLLNPAEIQGDSLAGFKKPYEIFLFFAIKDLETCRDSLKNLIPAISNLEQVWYFNRAFSAARRSGRGGVLSACWMNIAFTWHGLRTLWTRAPEPSDDAYVIGMRERARLLGDAQTQAVVRQWKFGGPETEPDFAVLIAADDLAVAERRCAEIAEELSGQHVVWKEVTENLGRRFVGTFGFRDGLSQPAVRCRLDISGRPRLDEDTIRDNEAEVRDFLLGYHEPSTDATYKDCSMTVFRRYVVLEKEFQEAVSGIVATLRKEHAIAAVCDEAYLASRLMGRWPNGAFVGTNLERRFVETLDRTESAVNLFDRDVLRSCPYSSHIRKAYPRNDIPEKAQRRIIRRGMPFERKTDNAIETGLMFVCYQSSIQDHFEHIQRRWMNNPNFPEDSVGYDPIVGQNAIGISRTRFVTLSFPMADGGFNRIKVELPNEFVRLDGGCYAMAVSLPLLKTICEGS